MRPSLSLLTTHHSSLIAGLKAAEAATVAVVRRGRLAAEVQVHRDPQGARALAVAGQLVDIQLAEPLALVAVVPVDGAVHRHRADPGVQRHERALLVGGKQRRY